MTTAGIDRSVLEIMTSELNAEGYSVFIEPRGAVLPEELRDLQPDAIAVKGIKKIAIQVKAGRSRPRDTSPSPVLPSGAAEAGWELRVYYAGLATSEDIRSMPRDKIAASLNEAQKLADDGLLSAALLVSWATFEALARSLRPASFVKPQTPRRIVEVLASEGTLMPDEADHVRSLIDVRNAAIHGDLLVRPSKEDVSRFVQIMRSLMDREVVPA